LLLQLALARGNSSKLSLQVWQRCLSRSAVNLKRGMWSSL
jgi:hypothetical protein